ncbi:flavodoxin domain-containing protein [Micrococcus sp. FDAARGOS_333]|uniref:flavodoxin domain-containing protein n=1 Tax=Micrococcus sp. FDAARGOS_333 TaxID=1930558 RepID=UPI000B4E7C10|nr:flavodoxin domain-containing protein [Micrococcus sp. FDAARGOS_333]PNL18655.1 flavodoxin [Micrococcus sp. FDAARGOS_333]
MTTLFVTSSSHGSTREIAERMAQVLRTKQAVETVVEDVAGAAAWLDTAYAVVVCAPVYAGKLAADAKRFLDSRRAELADKPLNIVVSGGSPQLDDALRIQLEAYRPRSVEYFRGAVTEERLGFLDKLKIKLAKGEYGDFRDWNAIEAHASALVQHGAR